MNDRLYSDLLFINKNHIDFYMVNLYLKRKNNLQKLKNKIYFLVWIGFVDVF